MPSYVVFRVDEIPGDGQIANALVFRCTATDEPAAVKAAMAAFWATGTNPGMVERPNVLGATTVANVTRYTATPSWAVVPGTP